MKKAARLVAVVGILAIIAAACGGDGGGGTTGATGTGATGTGATGATGGSVGAPYSGGVIEFGQTSDVASAFDPQKEYYQLSFGYFNCCLLRTLLATRGIPAEEGGDELLPDLAADLPTVSDDGLTYTFTIKPGIMYAPPLQDVEITAQDFVRAIEREADPKASSGGYPFYYSVIEGFDDFGAGEADSISGLSAPDDQTFVVTITQPTGDLPWRFAMPATAPIPPNPSDPSARLGVAEGHTKNYGRFLVASGPYMFEGSEALDFSVPADDQQEVSGYIPGRQIVLVPNPSWDQATDDLRPALPERIEATIGGDVADLYNKVEAGEIQYVADANPPADVLRDYSTDPDKQPFLHVYPQNAQYYIALNLGVPPFDDVHVRKAANLAFNKAGNIQLNGGPLVGEPAKHIFPNTLVGGLLADYDPYATPDNSGDIEAAKAEMAQSKYDADGDGVCDDPVCEQVLVLGVRQDPGPKTMALFTENMKDIGITVDGKMLDGPVIYSKCISSPDQVPACLSVGWVQDFPDAVTFGPPLFGSESLYPACCNYQLTGVSADQLKEWGYPAGTTIPSVDDQLAACGAMPVGDERYQCWADFDKYMMEEVVPWVPRIVSNTTDITSSDVTNYAWSYWGQQAAFGTFSIT